MAFGWKLKKNGSMVLNNTKKNPKNKTINEMF